MPRKVHIIACVAVILALLFSGCSDTKKIEAGVPQQQIVEDVYPEVWDKVGSDILLGNHRIGDASTQFPYEEFVEESIEKCTHNIDKEKLTDTVVIKGCFENEGQTRDYTVYAYYRYDGRNNQWWCEGVTVK